MRKLTKLVAISIVITSATSGGQNTNNFMGGYIIITEMNIEGLCEYLLNQYLVKAKPVAQINVTIDRSIKSLRKLIAESKSTQSKQPHSNNEAASMLVKVLDSIKYSDTLVQTNALVSNIEEAINLKPELMMVNETGESAIKALREYSDKITDLELKSSIKSLKTFETQLAAIEKQEEISEEPGKEMVEPILALKKLAQIIIPYRRSNPEPVELWNSSLMVLRDLRKQISRVTQLNKHHYTGARLPPPTRHTILCAMVPLIETVSENLFCLRSINTEVASTVSQPEEFESNLANTDSGEDSVNEESNPNQNDQQEAVNIINEMYHMITEIKQRTMNGDFFGNRNWQKLENYTKPLEKMLEKLRRVTIPVHKTTGMVIEDMYKTIKMASASAGYSYHETSPLKGIENKLQSLHSRQFEGEIQSPKKG